MEENKLTENEIKVLSDVLKKTVINIHKTAESEEDAKKNCRYADTHLFAFLSYLGVSMKEINTISKGAAI